MRDTYATERKGSALNKEAGLVDLFLKRGRVKVDLDSRCWIFNGTKIPTGYGTISILGMRDYAHRMSWRLFRGRIPNGKYVLHKCDVRDCVNPGHLWIGTQAENMADMIAKGRGNYGVLVGSSNPLAVLTKDVSHRILLDAKNGLSEKMLVKKYGVSKGTINNVRTGKHWTVRQ